MSPYLDYILHDDDWADDDGHTGSIVEAQHFGFGGIARALSDLNIPNHQSCSERTNESEVYFNERSRGNSEEFQRLRLSRCLECGWWQVVDTWHTEPGSFLIQERSHFYTGVTRVFSREDHDAIKQIAFSMEKGSRHLRAITPRQMEKAIASIFRDYYGATEVKHLGGNDDRGLDVLAVIADRTHLIQVKRRTDGTAEGVRTVRDLIGAYTLNHKKIGTAFHAAHIMTTAPRFSPFAKRDVRSEELERFGFTIEMHAFDQMKEIFSLAAGTVEEPWKHLPLGAEVLDKLDHCRVAL